MARFLGLLSALALVFLAAVSCGRKGADAELGGVTELDARNRVEQLLLCAVAGDRATAEQHLALAEFSGLLTQSRPKPIAEMTPAERETMAKACFNQLVAVTQNTALRDQTSIRAALAAAQVNVAPKIRHADVTFMAPRADGKGAPLRYRASLALYNEGGWHLISCEEQFNR